MATDNLTDMQKKLQEISTDISKGNVDTLSSTTKEFTRAIAEDARIPRAPANKSSSG